MGLYILMVKFSYFNDFVSELKLKQVDRSNKSFIKPHQSKGFM